MSRRLVRCPFCGKRFNVGGVIAGTSLRCTGCTAVLSVPREASFPSSPRRLTRALLLQVCGGVAAGLGVAAVFYLLLRPVQRPAETLAVRDAERPPAVERSEEPIREPLVIVGIPPGTQVAILRLQETLFKEFGTHFLFHDAEPYLLFAEPSEHSYSGAVHRTLVDLGGALRVLYASFRREFAGTLDLPAVEEPLVVVILNSRQSFEEYCRKYSRSRPLRQMKGFYEPHHRRFIVYHDHTPPYEQIFHEGVHQLVHYYTLRAAEGRTTEGTFWLQEGLGMFFEGFRRAEDGQVHVEFGINRARLPLLKQTLAQDPAGFVKLDMLAGTTVDAFWDWLENAKEREPDEAARRAQLCYAESWALVYFLRQRGGNYQKVFDEYLRAEISGTSSKEAFERLVREHLGMELSHLQQEFIDYVQSLR
jgi:hypothetical protein